MKTSQRIIFVSSIHAFGGVERLILSLSRFLYGNDIAHTVVCFSQSIDFAAYADWPMTVHELKPRRDPISEGIALNRYIKATYADGSPAPLLFDLKGAFYAGMLRLPAYHLHLTDPPSLLPSESSKFAFSLSQYSSIKKKPAKPGLAKMLRGEIAHRLNRRGASNALSVIAMTNSISDELFQLYSVKADIIRPGVKISTASIKLSTQSKCEVRFLSVCRLESNKRLNWILDALSRLESSAKPLSERIDWYLDVVGDGSQRDKLQSLADELGISERVLFHGRISDAMVEDVFASASVFLMPAIQGYGLPALEALARGVSVVLHRDSGVSEILKNNLWVEIIEDGVDDLASAINTMVGRICCNELDQNTMPKFPTESDWAHNICRQCNWLKH